MGINSTLGHDQILRLQAAITSARLTRSRDALLGHISPQFVASLPIAAGPGQQVLMDLDALRLAGELTDGTVPLAIWLANAIQLCGGQQEERVFAEALERVQLGAAARARPQSRQGISGSREADPAAVVVHHHHGDTHMGSNTINITGGTIGAIASGDHATATGYVTVGASGPITQEQHKAAITQAQNALNADQDTLERIDGRLYEALGQFLRLARQIQVEQQSIAEVQARMKATLDDVWAQQIARGMRPQALPAGLQVVEALAKSAATAQVATRLLGA